jgi:hypothetical protein
MIGGVPPKLVTEAEVIMIGGVPHHQITKTEEVEVTDSESGEVSGEEHAEEKEHAEDEEKEHAEEKENAKEDEEKEVEVKRKMDDEMEVHAEEKENAKKAEEKEDEEKEEEDEEDEEEDEEKEDAEEETNIASSSADPSFMAFMNEMRDILLSNPSFVKKMKDVFPALQQEEKKKAKHPPVDASQADSGNSASCSNQEPPQDKYWARALAQTFRSTSEAQGKGISSEGKGGAKGKGGRKGKGQGKDTTNAEGKGGVKGQGGAKGGGKGIEPDLDFKSILARFRPGGDFHSNLSCLTSKEIGELQEAADAVQKSNFPFDNWYGYLVNEVNCLRKFKERTVKQKIQAGILLYAAAKRGGFGRLPDLWLFLMRLINQKHCFNMKGVEKDFCQKKCSGYRAIYSLTNVLCWTFESSPFVYAIIPVFAAGVFTPDSRYDRDFVPIEEPADFNCQLFKALERPLLEYLEAGEFPFKGETLDWSRAADRRR